MGLIDRIPLLRKAEPEVPPLSKEALAKIATENESRRLRNGVLWMELIIEEAISEKRRFLLVQKDYRYRSDLEFAIACAEAANKIRQVVSLSLTSLTTGHWRDRDIIRQHALFTLDPDKV